jgi:hypothetical protein
MPRTRWVEVHFVAGKLFEPVELQRLAEGLRPNQVAVLTRHRRHPRAAREGRGRAPRAVGVSDRRSPPDYDEASRLARPRLGRFGFASSLSSHCSPCNARRRLVAAARIWLGFVAPSRSRSASSSRCCRCLRCWSSVAHPRVRRRPVERLGRRRDPFLRCERLPD